MKVVSNFNNQYNNKQQSPYQQNKQNRKNPAFGNWFSQGLRFLDTNQAWGANFVDLAFMVTPRTITDLSESLERGVETGRREGFGTANHSSVGLYGAGAGMLLGAGINSAYGLTDKKQDVRSHSIFADSETLNLHGEIYDKHLKASQTDSAVRPMRNYIEEVLSSYQALSPTEDGKWVSFNQKDIKDAAAILEEQISATGNKIAPEKLNEARNILASSIGAENNFRIIAKEGEKLHTSRYTVDSILENIYKLGKTFSKEKVAEAFLNSTGIESNSFIRKLAKMNMKRSLIGIGIASAVGVSAQPFNMYLTRRKTGKTGFVGGGEEDKSLKFKLKKAAVAGLFMTGVLATIVDPKNINLIKDIQFKGYTPTIKQFKFIYGITIFSRILSSRNDNELKETTTKDTLGFINWLILGNFVQKLVAQGLTKALGKYHPEWKNLPEFGLLKRDGSGVMNWIKNSVLKTRDEVLFSALKKEGRDVKNMKFNDMMGAIKNNKMAKWQLGILTVAQLAGYAYSGIVLGFGIPKLNIYLTKKRMEKQNQMNPQNTVDSNREFLKSNVQKGFTGTLINQ